jgi:lipopolysaccharide export LptBFGC system permease protein LptF
VVGVLIGVMYFLLTRTLENSAQVYDLSPMVVAWLPTLLLAAGTLVALVRTR